MRSTTPRSLQWFGLREITKSFPFNLFPLLRKPFLPTERKGRNLDLVIRMSVTFCCNSGWKKTISGRDLLHQNVSSINFRRCGNSRYIGYLVQMVYLTPWIIQKLQSCDCNIWIKLPNIGHAIIDYNGGPKGSAWPVANSHSKFNFILKSTYTAS